MHGKHILHYMRVRLVAYV